MIGFAFGNPQIGWMVGSSIGGLFGTKKGNGGPEMTDLRPQTSEYGRPIPIVYGTMALAGNVMWAADLIKVSDGDGGGKGGGGTPSGPRYAANFAILICESNGDHKLGRIWAGPEKRLIWDGNKLESGALVFYDGNDSQMPDPMMESYLGAGQVPAYRGYAYIVVEMFDVSEHDGNRIPFLTIEIGQAKVVKLGYVWPLQAYEKDGNIVLLHWPGSGGVIIAQSAAPHTFLHSFEYPIGASGDDSTRFFDPDRNLMVSFTGPNRIFQIMDLGSGAVTQHSFDEPAALVVGLPARSPYAGCARYHNGVYIFGMKQVGTSAAALYGVDPDTLATLWVYAYPGCPNNMLDFVATPADPTATYLIGLNNTSAMKFPLAPSTAAVSMGNIAPPQFTYNNPIFAVDPSTGNLWTTPSIVTSTQFRYTVHEPLTASKIYESTVNLAFTFHPTGFIYVPSQGMYCYGVSGLQDGFLKFDGGGPLDSAYIGAHSAGLLTIQTMFWEPVRGVLMQFRNGYGGALVEEVSLPGAAPTAVWSLGQSDVAVSGQSLSSVVQDLSVRAGLSPDQVDVSELADDVVDGYPIANQVTIRDAIATLMPVYYFDCVEDQGVLRFIKRGGDIAVEIPAEDLGAHGSDQDGVYDLYEMTRSQDEELPHTLSANYILAATKYSPATKYARRLVGNSGDEARIDVPLVLTDAKGAEVAAVNLHEQWVSRITYKLSLGRKYSHLMPTDLIGLPGPNGEGFTARITKETQNANGVIEFEAVRDDSDVYVPHVFVDETPPPGGVTGGGGTGGSGGGTGGGVSTPTAAVLEVLGINMLRDADNDSGYYVAVAAVDPSATWGGADLYYSVDGGTTYAKLLSIPNEATMGVTTSALGDFFGGNVPDELNSVNVQLTNGALSSTNNAGLLAGTFAFVIGDEIIFGRDAVLQTDGSYTLRGLLRGRRGSEYAMGTHQVGERFVLLDVSTLVRIPAGTDTIGVDKLYKAVAAGKTLAETIAVPFTNHATGLMPYAPVLLGGGRDASNNATLNWVRRSRISAEWRDGVEIPLGEATEAYEVEIFTSSARTTVARTITGLTSPTASYSAAQATADGLTPGATLYFRVFQLSAVVGRGHPADGSI